MLLVYKFLIIDSTYNFGGTLWSTLIIFYLPDEPVSPPSGEEARSEVSAAQAAQDRLVGMHAALQAQLASQLQHQHQHQQAAMAAAVAAAAAAQHHHQNNNVIGQCLLLFNVKTCSWLWRVSWVDPDFPVEAAGSNPGKFISSPLLLKRWRLPVLGSRRRGLRPFRREV